MLWIHLMNSAVTSGYDVFGIIGLILFMTIFLLVLVYTFRKGNQRRFSDAARLPLEDDLKGRRAR